MHTFLHLTLLNLERWTFVTSGLLHTRMSSGLLYTRMSSGGRVDDNYAQSAPLISD